MLDKPKKTRILSLSIIDKAIDAIEDVPMDRGDLLDIARKYNLMDVFDYYDETVSELNYQFGKRKSDLIKINELYLTRERLYRILNPTIYLNAYKEKRANDALYINANVGFIDDKGKVKNVVVFMGKSEETDLKRLKEKVESDKTFIEDAKRKIIGKLISKIQIPEFNYASNVTRRQLKKDTKTEFNFVTEKLVEKMRTLIKNDEESSESKEPASEKKSGDEALRLIRAFIKQIN